jgi:hypothetical protein
MKEFLEKEYPENPVKTYLTKGNIKKRTIIISDLV